MTPGRTLQTLNLTGPSYSLVFPDPSHHFYSLGCWRHAGMGYTAVLAWVAGAEEVNLRTCVDYVHLRMRESNTEKWGT